MSVQTIFKTIIGTIAIMVLYSCCVELFNANISGMQIKQTCNMAANQSAELVTQETYKETKSNSGEYSRSTKMKDLKAPDGTVYVSGDFYNGKKTTSEIWNMMYAGSASNFKKVCNTTKAKSTTIKTTDGDKVTYSLEEDDGVGYKYTYFANSKSLASIYRELDELYGGLYKSTNASALSATNMDWNEFLSGSTNNINKKSAGANALRMKENMFTPVNIGFPYFDPEVTNRIFRWDLAMILSNGDKDSIQTEKQSNGTKRYFINYKGFRCYANEASITNFKYYIIDTSTTSGQNELKKMIELDTDKINKIQSESTGKNNLKYVSTEENNYVAVVGIEYTIPIAYEGITPIAKIFKYVWNKEVEGLDNNTLYKDGTEVGRAGTGDWDFAASNMTNSSKSNNGMMPATGKLYYVLTR